MYPSHNRLITLINLSGVSVEAIDHSFFVNHTEDQTHYLFGLSKREALNIDDARNWNPLLTAVEDYPSKDIGFDNNGHIRGDELHIQAFSTFLGIFPYTGIVLGLVADFISGDPDNCIRLEQLLFDPRTSITVAGRPLIERVRDRLRDLIQNIDDLTDFGLAQVAQDRHQLLICNDANLIGYEGPGELGCPLTVADFNYQVLFAILYKTRIDSEGANSVAWTFRESTPISFPEEMNSDSALVVAVKATNTVVYGLATKEELGRIRACQMTLAAGQVVAALGRMRRLRSMSLEVINEYKRSAYSLQIAKEPTFRDYEERRTILLDLEEKFRQVRIGTAFGATIYMSRVLVRGGIPIENYHETVREHHDFDNTVKTLGQILELIANLISHERDSLDSYYQLTTSRATRQLLETTDAAKTAGIVFAIVMGVVSIVGLFAALAAIPDTTEQWTPRIMETSTPAVGMAVMIVSLATFLGLVLAKVSKLTISSRKLRRTNIIAAGLLGVLAAALMGRVALNVGSEPIGDLAIGLILLVASLLAGSLGFQFEIGRRRKLGGARRDKP